MCGFVGIADFKNDISNKKEILLNMNSTLSKRGPDEDGFYINSHIALAHKRLIVIDADGGIVCGQFHSRHGDFPFY